MDLKLLDIDEATWRVAWIRRMDADPRDLATSLEVLSNSARAAR
jgi:hypothetical protein